MQPAVGWVDGLIADGESALLLAPKPGHHQDEEDGGGVFKAGVPISAVPDDGEWAISPREKEAEAGAAPSLAPEAPSKVPPDQQPPRLPNRPGEQEEDLPPTSVRRACEGFTPQKRDYGEMPVSLGDVIHAFETLSTNGWVFGYKHNAKDEVVDQGWLPSEILVTLDTPLDGPEEQPATPPPPPPPADHDDEQDWKMAGRRPVRSRPDRQVYKASSEAPQKVAAVEEDHADRAPRSSRPGRGGGEGAGRGGKDGVGRGRGGNTAGLEKGEKGGREERPMAKGRDAKGAARGSARGGGEKGKGRGRHASGS